MNRAKLYKCFLLILQQLRYSELICCYHRLGSLGSSVAECLYSLRRTLAGPDARRPSVPAVHHVAVAISTGITMCQMRYLVASHCLPYSMSNPANDSAKAYLCVSLTVRFMSRNGLLECCSISNGKTRTLNTALENRPNFSDSPTTSMNGVGSYI